MQLSYVLSTAVNNYEMDKLGGQGFAEADFQEGVKNLVPDGHIFQAFPI